MTTAVSTADISAATGSLANNLDLTFNPTAPTLLGAMVKWGRVLTANERGQLLTVLEV